MSGAIPALRVVHLLQVGLGGMVGTAARFGLTGALPVHPVIAVIIVNLVGSFVLGSLVAWFRSDRPGRQLFWGAGVCGGFTTYSALAVGALPLGGDATWAPAWATLTIAFVTIIAGVCAVFAGMWIGARLRGRIAEESGQPGQPGHPGKPGHPRQLGQSGGHGV